MKLGIISDCIHYKNEAGQIGTENHILLRQFEQLAGHFSVTTVACPFATVDGSKVISWYTKKIRFIELPLVGGDNFKDKLQFFKVLPAWFRGFEKIDQSSDVVYQRFPNNLNVPGFFYFFIKRKKVFATYTGTWLHYQGEPLTYRLQRWLLANWFRGPVWVYTATFSNNPRILPGFSPSYSMAEWEEESPQVVKKISTLQCGGLQLFRLITVGTLINYKNQLTILKACVILKSQQFPFTLKVVGHGPMYNELKIYIEDNGLQNEVELVGKKTYQALRTLYRQSDFVVQAPLKEGFGKVPVEGFFHGVVPVLNDVSMARHMTGNEERGFLFDGTSAQNLADMLIKIKSKTSLLPKMIENGRQFAKSQTLESWANEYYATVSEFY